MIEINLKLLYMYVNATMFFFKKPFLVIIEVVDQAFSQTGEMRDSLYSQNVRLF